ncbi:AraC family transcriptional regulator [Opitutaceae bacterium TAV5]|nr:AraC family transcriptional regulator [Opitutaceae bacterium TAV5]
MLFPLDQLEHLLRAPLQIICTCRETFSGHRTRDEHLVSHRYIRILKGSLTYTIDGNDARLDEGAIFFVPRHAHRYWRVPEGEVCELVWCQFDAPGFDPGTGTLYLADDSRRSLEKASLLRMLRLWTFPGYMRASPHGDPALPREIALQLEGELKASMVRFWVSARPWDPAKDQAPAGSASRRRVHPSVRRGLTWLEENFRRPDAIKLLHAEILDVSPNHFRLLFSRYAGHSVSAHLLQLRMREAMTLLQTTTLSIKEIAARVGFSDPLYFSRRFHEHWDVAPTALRK